MEDLTLNTTVSVDLDEVQEFIESEKFIQFLLNNTTNLSIALFIVQTVNDKIEELKKLNKESD